MIFAPLHTGFIGADFGSVAVSVGSSPPTISVHPQSKTAISVGTRIELSITAAAGTGAISKYELFKDGTEIDEISTAATSHTFVIESFKLPNEGDYFIRVTQVSGSAYKDSNIALLRMYWTTADGKPRSGLGRGIDPERNNVVPAEGVIDRVDGWQNVFNTAIAPIDEIDETAIQTATDAANTAFPNGPGSVIVHVNNYTGKIVFEEEVLGAGE